MRQRGYAHPFRVGDIRQGYTENGGAFRSASALPHLCRRRVQGRWLSLPTAYSDNAGLISAGLTAQVITVLPRAEAELLMRYMPHSAGTPLSGNVHSAGCHRSAVAEISANESAAQALQRCIITNAHVPPDSPLAAVIPQTWQRMHTPQDSLETLTPQAFILVDKMLRYLAGVKEAAG